MKKRFKNIYDLKIIKILICDIIMWESIWLNRFFNENEKFIIIELQDAT